MFPLKVPGFILPAVAFVLAVALTPLVRALARRIGIVAKPKIDRWHKKPTAMLGGLGIWLSVIITYLFFLPHNSQTWVIVACSTFLFFVGLVDDILHIKPYQKLIGQIIGAAAVVNYGLTLPWTSSPSIDVVITIFWLIGITNAINLLDNMDGLATGIAAIASGLPSKPTTTTFLRPAPLIAAAAPRAIVSFPAITPLMSLLP